MTLTEQPGTRAWQQSRGAVRGATAAEASPGETREAAWDFGVCVQC